MVFSCFGTKDKSKQKQYEEQSQNKNRNKNFGSGKNGEEFTVPQQNPMKQIIIRQQQQMRRLYEQVLDNSYIQHSQYGDQSQRSNLKEINYKQENNYSNYQEERGLYWEGNDKILLELEDFSVKDQQIFFREKQVLKFCDDKIMIYKKKESKKPYLTIPLNNQKIFEVIYGKEIQQIQSNLFKIGTIRDINMQDKNYNNVKGIRFESVKIGQNCSDYEKINNIVFFTENQIDFAKLEQFVEARIFRKNFHRDFKLLQKIGQGGCAKVYQGQNRQSKKIFAVKVFKKWFQDTSREKMIQIYEQNLYELQMMSNLKSEENSQYCSQIQYIYQDHVNIYVILDLVKGGDLQNYLIKNEKLDKGSYGYMLRRKDIATIMNKCLQCLKYINSRGIMHRDLKPENLLLRNKNDINSLIFADFGLSTEIRLNQYQSVKVGTPGYIAPEIYFSKRAGDYNERCDIYSLGVIFHILLIGEQPFYNSQTQDSTEVMFQNALSSIDFNQKRYSHLKDNEISLLKQMLEKNFKYRINVDFALQHKYFDEFKGWSKEEKQEIKYIDTKEIKCSNNYTQQNSTVIQNKLSQEELIDNTPLTESEQFEQKEEDKEDEKEDEQQQQQEQENKMIKKEFVQDQIRKMNYVQIKNQEKIKFDSIRSIDSNDFNKSYRSYETASPKYNDSDYFIKKESSSTKDNIINNVSYNYNINSKNKQDEYENQKENQNENESEKKEDLSENNSFSSYKGVRAQKLQRQLTQVPKKYDDNNLAYSQHFNDINEKIDQSVIRTRQRNNTYGNFNQQDKEQDKDKDYLQYQYQQYQYQDQGIQRKQRELSQFSKYRFVPNSSQFKVINQNTSYLYQSPNHISDQKGLRVNKVYQKKFQLY
ncbi:Protein kinase-like domain [Pseudocohnilembus persalinus]|uniref:Protein kinase-like domain n=1 Tax=Pseudocohnilembus persalinus TaxID=266149 RepID=A0A0V0QDS8_PSEPJ|nr:Protein kinase-like domain [Pseudocohnilembus persalinus]|eukprot:KRX00355.1 Protein kinase-like domain [Pseudocohnilembus persalinus]